MENFLEQTVEEQRETLSQMKQSMEHAAAEHSVSLNDMKKIVRNSSLERLVVQKERTERQIEIKKARFTFWVRVSCGI
jgi:hypothetical protein